MSFWGNIRELFGLLKSVATDDVAAVFYPTVRDEKIYSAGQYWCVYQVRKSEIEKGLSEATHRALLEIVRTLLKDRIEVKVVSLVEDERLVDLYLLVRYNRKQMLPDILKQPFLNEVSGQAFCNALSRLLGIEQVPSIYFADL